MTALLYYYSGHSSTWAEADPVHRHPACHTLSGYTTMNAQKRSQASTQNFGSFFTATATFGAAWGESRCLQQATSRRELEAQNASPGLQSAARASHFRLLPTERGVWASSTLQVYALQLGGDMGACLIPGLWGRDSACLEMWVPHADAPGGCCG